jgi:hypothetical protein
MISEIVGAEGGKRRTEIKMYRNCMMRRKVKETSASLIGSRASTLFLGFKYICCHD